MAAPTQYVPVPQQQNLKRKRQLSRSSLSSYSREPVPQRRRIENNVLPLQERVIHARLVVRSFPDIPRGPARNLAQLKDLTLQRMYWRRVVGESSYWPVAEMDGLPPPTTSLPDPSVPAMQQFNPLSPRRDDRDKPLFHQTVCQENVARASQSFLARSKIATGTTCFWCRCDHAWFVSHVAGLSPSGRRAPLLTRNRSHQSSRCTWEPPRRPRKCADTSYTTAPRGRAREWGRRKEARLHQRTRECMNAPIGWNSPSRYDG